MENWCVVSRRRRCENHGHCKTHTHTSNISSMWGYIWTFNLVKQTFLTTFWVWIKQKKHILYHLYITYSDHYASCRFCFFPRQFPSPDALDFITIFLFAVRRLCLSTMCTAPDLVNPLLKRPKTKYWRLLWILFVTINSILQSKWKLSLIIGAKMLLKYCYSSKMHWR